jgi:pyruvate kinase
MPQRTKIVATIGPTTNSPKMMEAILQAGVDVFRLNFSHGDYDSYEKMITDIKKVREKMGIPLPIILDTKGPEIRTADLKTPLEVKPGDEIVFTISDEKIAGKNRVSYDGLVKDTENGAKIMIDSGLMSAEVVGKTETDVICKMITGGTIGSRRHINLPGKDISLPSITDKDWADLKFGLKHDLDFCAMSFVRRASDIQELRKFLRENNSQMKIIAKIENKLAVDNLEEIIAEADGVMVARGDLGVELPYYKVPEIQARIIRLSAKYQKPVIVATEMLDSMIETPYPTRAEVADVSTAVFQRTDATMLSGETAGGKYPAKSVEVMTQILREAGENVLKKKNFRDLEVESDHQAMAKAVAEFTYNNSDIEAVVVITKSGRTAESVASHRPRLKIFAFSDNEQVVRQMNLLWGVHPDFTEFNEQNPEQTVRRAIDKLLEKNPNLKNKKIILLSSTLVKDRFVINLQLRKI